MRRNFTPIAFVMLFALAPIGCGTEEPADYTDDSFWTTDEGAADIWTQGMPDPGWEVWQPVHAWTDTAPNGETYEQYYATWLAGIQHNEEGRDVAYTLADGTVVPAPSLECADTAMFLRFLFAEEHGLPIILRGGGYYFGHFGFLNTSGVRQRNYARHPVNAARGSYAALQNHNTYLPDNLQDYPSEGVTLGQYLDAVLTNKRFGFFMQDVWNMLYSGNIVENTNTYYLKPEFIRGGDLQMHRYDNTGGIGHTITIQEVERSGDRLVSVSVLQSYMPTLPWISDGYSELTGYTPDPATHGGLRRWRRPVQRNGRWFNDVDSTVAAYDSEVVNNPQRFEELFNMSSNEQVEAALATINTRRRALFDNPNSCRRREEREAAFEELYELYRTTPELYQQLGFNDQPTLDELRPAVDRQHRVIDDFVFAELNYERAWTCQWNPSDTAVNNDMYRATLAFNEQRLASGCESIRIFRAENVTLADGTDGFADLAAFASENGYGWATYSNDEGGNLSGVTEDELADPDTISTFCSLFANLTYWTQP